MLKAIIFDFDGVIANTYELNLMISREIFPEMTKDEFEALHMGNPLHKKNWTEADALSFAQKQKNLFFKHHFFVQMVDLVRDLKKGNDIKLFIISSSSDENIKEYLKLVDIDKLFTQILGADTHKSKEVKFSMVFDKYKLTPNDVLFITDTVGDIKEAQKMAVPTVAVTWGYHDYRTLKQAKPDYLVESVAKLRQLLRLNEIRLQ